MKVDISELRERAESTAFDHQYVDVRKDELLALLDMVKASPIVPVEITVWYMHDNHTFTRLHGDMAAVIDAARKIAYESSYGMLGSAILLNSDGGEVRRVGKSIHARIGFEEGDLIKWRESVLSDPDAARLFAARGAA